MRLSRATARRPAGVLGMAFDDLVAGGGAVAFDGEHAAVQPAATAEPAMTTTMPAMSSARPKP
ncbi:hypothetical protein DLJ47_32255 [Micromonospora sp. S4605]|nr:hypothetical protein DLJ47_32255 [Micromonospora sp. S4605]